MMSSNKILTVSYGTFSCTLEGFDDSFDTMKAIAEYFRDLAADDRYFGAEPPQPDAEMLARIAEREVSRRVEAREHEGRIMLKAHEEPADADPEPAPVQDATPATAAAAAVVAAAADLPDLGGEPQEETQAFSAPYTDAPEPPVTEGLSDPTDQMTTLHNEAPVISTPAYEDASSVSPQAEDDVEAYDAVASDQDISDLAALDGEPPVSETDVATDQTDPTKVDMDAAAAFFAGSVVSDGMEPETEDTISVEAFTGYISAAEPASEAVADDEPETPAAPVSEQHMEEDGADLIDETLPETSVEPAHDDLILDESDAPQTGFPTESFADKLARIRAVVTKQDKSEAPENYDDEDSDAISGFADEAAAVEVSALEFVEEDDAQTATATEELNSADVSDEFEGADDIAAVAAEIEDAFDADAAAQMEIVEEEGDDLDAILDEIEASGDGEEFVASTTNTEHADQEPATLAEEEVSVEDAADIFDEADVDTTPVDDTHNEQTEGNGEERSDEEVAAPTLAARMMTTPREDFEEALASGELEDMDAAAERAHEAPSAADDEPVPAASQSSTTARDALPEIGENAGEDVSRLMAEADQQMEEPEGQTRRSAFAHLRAAVAARFADRSMDAEAQEAEEQEEAYRSDLAEVVKPRRPETQEAPQHSRPDTRPAPLKLVAEQRIDEANPTIDTNVAPRRVAAPEIDDAEAPEESGFATYAEERGASTLPELLEAAASYLCFVEGQDEFSRPQLMTRVRQADVGEFTREDGLRSFGQLLRTGKIEKIAGGRFVASDAIGYKPDHRAAG